MGSVHSEKSETHKLFEIFFDFRGFWVFSAMGGNDMLETTEQSDPMELLSDQIQEIFYSHRSQAK